MVKNVILRASRVLLLILMVGFSARPVVAGDNLQKSTTVWYVSPSGQDADGTSWATAFPDLQDALAAASSGDEIWAAAGVYVPGSTAADRFDLVPGVALYGGFAGYESSLAERDWEANLTILSGDIDGDDINEDGNSIAETAADIQGSNSECVVYAWASAVGGSFLSTTLLDGVVITGGKSVEGGGKAAAGAGFRCYAQNSGRECSPRLVNVIFAGNTASLGGAMANSGYYGGISSPCLVNVTFTGNTAREGGAMFNEGVNGTSSPSLVNVTFAGNTAREGGAIFTWGQNIYSTSSPSLVNVTFAGNTATQGGAMFT